jgi:polyamine oxidase
MQSNWALALAGATLLASGIEAAAVPSPPQALKRDNSTCQRTKVAILGAGVAGITAAQALSNASITDFLIVDRNSYIGGRVTDTTFGTKPDGTPYTVELGANWVQGLGSPDGPENPIWTLAKKYAIDNTYSDYDSLLTYDEGGEADFGDLFDDFDAAYEVAAVEAGRMLTENLQDTSARTGLSLAGWKPQFDMRALAVEWWGWDFNAASPPEDGSLVFGVAGENLTFNYFSDENNFVWDQRGFNTFVQGEAHEFLEDGDDDPRLLLDTLVTGIAYTDDSVVVHLDGDAGCIEAEHAIVTFSLGVLQNDVVEFDPPLPDWKREAIAAFVMGTYTKIFFQFNETFWDPETEYFLYADPHERGRYPVWQSIDAPGFVEGSHIIFVTVTNDQSYVVEQQTDEETKAEAMEVLRAMFPDVDVPEPIDFMYPRWTTEE